LRERLEAAIENADPREVRRIVGQFALSPVQRRRLEGMLDDWELALAAAVEDLETPGNP
jgi:hypothetical protein